MFCTSCGAKIEDKAQFCPKCGTKVEKEIAGEQKASRIVEKKAYWKIISAVGGIAVLIILVVGSAYVKSKKQMSQCFLPIQARPLKNGDLNLGRKVLNRLESPLLMN